MKMGGFVFLLPLQKKTMSVKILEIAISQLGVSEDRARTNHGQAIKYQDAAGLPKGGGYPWCQSFVYWCGLQAYGSGNPIPRTPGVLDCWDKALIVSKIAPDIASYNTIPAGSQFIMNLGHGKGHTGFVESIDADGTMHTIEGNANPDTASREGYEVCRKNTRKITDVELVGFICYDYPDSATT